MESVLIKVGIMLKVSIHLFSKRHNFLVVSLAYIYLIAKSVKASFKTWSAF